MKLHLSGYILAVEMRIPPTFAAAFDSRLLEWNAEVPLTAVIQDLLYWHAWGLRC